MNSYQNNRAWLVNTYRFILLLYGIFIIVQLVYVNELFKQPALTTDQQFTYNYVSVKAPFINEDVGVFYSINRDRKTNLPCCHETRLYFGWKKTTQRFSGDLDSSLAIISGVTKSASFIDTSLDKTQKKQIKYFLISAFVLHSVFVLLYMKWGGEVLIWIMTQTPFERKTIRNIKKIGWLTFSIPFISFMLQFLLNNVPDSFKDPIIQLRSYRLIQDYDWQIMPFVIAGIAYIVAKAFELGKKYRKDTELTI